MTDLEPSEEREVLEEAARERGKEALRDLNGKYPGSSLIVLIFTKTSVESETRRHVVTQWSLDCWSSAVVRGLRAVTDWI